MMAKTVTSRRGCPYIHAKKKLRDVPIRESGSDTMWKLQFFISYLTSQTAMTRYRGLPPTPMVYSRAAWINFRRIRKIDASK
jgi:hypothetical protein